LTASSQTTSSSLTAIRVTADPFLISQRVVERQIRFAKSRGMKELAQFLDEAAMVGMVHEMAETVQKSLEKQGVPVHEWQDWE